MLCAQNIIETNNVKISSEIMNLWNVTDIITCPY